MCLVQESYSSEVNWQIAKVSSPDFRDQTECWMLILVAEQICLPDPRRPRKSGGSVTKIYPMAKVPYLGEWQYRHVFKTFPRKVLKRTPRSPSP